MNARERAGLREELIDRLTAIYQTVRENLSATTVALAVEPDPADESDEGVIDELRSLDGSLSERNRELAHALEDALRRMRNDDYGICIDCGREISLARLRSVPWTLRCADDQEAREERGRVHPPSL
jgi:DnaK suppressor protein